MLPFLLFMAAFGWILFGTMWFWSVQLSNEIEAERRRLAANIASLHEVQDESDRYFLAARSLQDKFGNAQIMITTLQGESAILSGSLAAALEKSHVRNTAGLAAVRNEEAANTRANFLESVVNDLGLKLKSKEIELSATKAEMARIAATSVDRKESLDRLEKELDRIHVEAFGEGF